MKIEIINDIRLRLAKQTSKPVIFGLKSFELSKEEEEFFIKQRPLGFILFARNISTKIQVKALTDKLKSLFNYEILILIDQEGGRVSRLHTNEWKRYPSPHHFTNLISEIGFENAGKKLYENYKNIALDLHEIGINVCCAPTLDILTAETHSVIGDRSFGGDLEIISKFGKITCNALSDHGVLSVIKHIPGHGRGNADSHLELPVVNTKIDELRKTDFVPFINLRNSPFAMSAHILYRDIDKNEICTMSEKVISVIRNEIGFKNLLMTDDLSMKAMSGTITEKVTKSLRAGCDIILHCNGDMEEMSEITAVLNSIL